jgi:hypothetical protein
VRKVVEIPTEVMVVEFPGSKSLKFVFSILAMMVWARDQLRFSIPSTGHKFVKSFKNN